jgi:hypothetical protein
MGFVIMKIYPTIGFQVEVWLNRLMDIMRSTIRYELSL